MDRSHRRSDPKALSVVSHHHALARGAAPWEIAGAGVVLHPHTARPARGICAGKSVLYAWSDTDAGGGGCRAPSAWRRAGRALMPGVRGIPDVCLGISDHVRA